MTSPFVTSDDVRKIENYDDFLADGISFDEGYITFMDQLYAYFKECGCEEHIIEPLKNHEIEKFNENIRFPSYSSYCFFDNYFTGELPELKLMNQTSRNFLGYFYDIWFHGD